MIFILNLLYVMVIFQLDLFSPKNSNLQKNFAGDYTTSFVYPAQTVISKILSRETNVFWACHGLNVRFMNVKI